MEERNYLARVRAFSSQARKLKEDVLSVRNSFFFFLSWREITIDV